MTETPYQRDLRQTYERNVLDGVLRNVIEVVDRAPDVDITPDVILLITNAMIDARPYMPHVHMPVAAEGVIVTSKDDGSWRVHLADGYGRLP